MVICCWELLLKSVEKVKTSFCIVDQMLTCFCQQIILRTAVKIFFGMRVQERGSTLALDLCFGVYLNTVCTGKI